jgi:hypothetical protein
MYRMEDDEVDQVTPVVEKPKRKSTKGQPRTPAQQEAFKKALTILKERREMKVKDEKERYEKANADEKARIEKEKFEKAKTHKKKLPPAPSYVTTGDLEKFKMDILNAIPKFEAPKVEIKKPIEPPTPKHVVKSVVAEKPLTGHDLLDKLFFN